MDRRKSGSGVHVFSHLLRCLSVALSKGVLTASSTLTSVTTVCGKDPDFPLSSGPLGLLSITGDGWTGWLAPGSRSWRGPAVLAFLTWLTGWGAGGGPWGHLQKPPASPCTAWPCILCMLTCAGFHLRREILGLPKPPRRHLGF